MRTDRYGLIGHPVAHSRSPLIHQLFARQLGETLSYELIDAPPEKFESTVRDFGESGGLGLNVTIPHKEAAYALCTSHGAEAKVAAAVNTISFTEGGIHGDNTDGIGFIRDLKINHERVLASRRVLVLGAGGAARGIIGPILSQHPASLVIANRTLQRAEALCRHFHGATALSVLSFDELGDAGAFDIVINATSTGLKGEQPSFPASLVRRKTFCYDLAYSLKPTPFIVWAQASGAGLAVQGWGMLVEQAAESYAIWRGRRPETRSILQTLTSINA